jgi:hypothetical protein
MPGIFIPKMALLPLHHIQPRKRIALTEYMKRKIPSLAATRWSFSSRLVNVVEEHRILILENFGSS